MVSVVDLPTGVEGIVVFEARDAQGVPIPGPTLAVVGMIHGNEPVGRQAVGRLREVCSERLTSGRLITVLANLEAERLGLRHTPGGVDMNRLWDADRLARMRAQDPSELAYEHRRVLEVVPWLLQAEAILDLHSTSRPSPPHLIFRDDYAHAELARQLGVERLVTGVHESGVLSGGICANAGLALGKMGSKVGLTLEAGQHDDPRNIEAAWSVVERFLAAMGVWSTDLPPYEGEFEVYELIDRFRQAPAGHEPYRFVGYQGGEPGSVRHGPPRELASFEQIEADEIILRRGVSEVIRASSPFVMIMPAPTADPGADLYYVGIRRHASLQRRPSDDLQARVEAQAMERMLDLMTDDEAQAGITRVAFDGRRVLDLCADLVMRVARLPAGHPHRRLVVVGRGDWDEEDVDNRQGERYRRALQLALESGVPVERVQLLRGASEQWLHKLGGDVVRRAAAEGTPMSILVSERQPHSVSVLLAGDVERALSSGDFHHVRVALVVEAATVEAREESVRTHVARSGIFGSRYELVQTAGHLVDQLREEHRALWDSGIFGTLPEGLTADPVTRAIRVTRPDAAPRLTGVLLRAQRSMWRDLLRLHLTQTQVFSRREPLNRWLVRLMANTGIMDSRALFELVERDPRGRWRVRRELADARLLTGAGEPQIVEQTDEAGAASSSRLTASGGALQACLQATEVDRDSIERWIGWKRFVRSAQTLPGLVGRDVLLAFSKDRIEERLFKWMREVRELAIREPGRWMIVVAGDGMVPVEAGDPVHGELARLHQELVRCPQLRYLRIQNARGTRLAWMKGLIEELGARPTGGEPASVCWEMEHGSAINVVMICEHTSDDRGSPWSLDAWRVTRCGVLIADPLQGVHGGHDVAAFTGGVRGITLNQELAHFCRAHCEGLLRQVGLKVTGAGGPAMQLRLQQVVQRLLSVQLRQMWMHHAEGPADPEERAEWLASRTSVADDEVTRRFVEAAGALHGADEPDTDALAASLWRSVERWPAL